MHDFTVLVLPGAFAASVAASLDILRTAQVLASRLDIVTPRWRVTSAAGGNVLLSSGMYVETVALPKRRQREGSIWVVPGLGLDDVAAVQSRLALPDAQRAALALAAHAKQGGNIAASCSAVFLLHTAGLLAQRRVTTSWWMASELQRLEPNCFVDAGRMVCADGALTTAGAAFAHTDLMLHLLRGRFGPALADAVGRVLLIDGRQAQSKFVVPAMLATGNALIARLIQRVESALPHAPGIDELAKEFAMSPRTLSRHVRAATGASTLSLVQIVKLNRARMLIESSKLSMEDVAARVGYQDATALRRLVRKTGGANPSSYRKGNFST